MKLTQPCLLLLATIVSAAFAFKLGDLEHNHDHSHEHDGGDQDHEHSEHHEHSENHDHDHEHHEQHHEEDHTHDDVHQDDRVGKAVEAGYFNEQASAIDFSDGVPIVQDDGSTKICVEKEEFREELK